MKLHWIQHVPFEGLGYIEEWATTQNMDISSTRLYANETLPIIDDFDWLVIMGGPMGIFDCEEHPWLCDEKEFIKQAIDEHKTVIGICLGAQLMADVLGAKVYPGPQKEIGWHPIQRTAHASTLIPEDLTVFHWHSDTFDIPEGAEQMATSRAGINQGFAYKDRAIGLQFHMETKLENMEALITHCHDELVDAPYIQSAEQMRAGFEHIKNVNNALGHLLNSLL